uniref:Mitochondrial carrier protein n=1 Tax=Chromera velia CCMP2878 TaxID=1169474 RepID=A0A0G4H4I6_9ALVE|eukprot:Cvel_5665.t1-p1 / transcript=Cvel_5665.t1 / gene=Cvel_5665 / organism=Chromera_velia_CCMP2878 / gene_product=Putative mitochondrial carrier protein PET8, putative / transcript_product=Putative mitochondrial carrier protein PET8, putative / location=Cvel_scaffold267:73743-76904(-) / protein_length=256 / sequence_SO=supercontig / SO=protein_coding / is_pseudo=false
MGNPVVDALFQEVGQVLGSPGTRYFLASALATVPMGVVKCPFEIVKQRQQVNDKGSTALQILQKILNKKSGWRGLFAGLDAQLLRDLPFNAIQLPLYETFRSEFGSLWSSFTVKGRLDVPIGLVKRIFVGDGSGVSAFPSPLGSAAQTQTGALVAAGAGQALQLQEQEQPLWLAAVAGFLAAALAALATQPLDTVKTREMTDEELENSSLLEAFRKVWVEEGWRSLFAGLAPRIALVSVGGSVYFYANEFAKAFFR